jgi:hypothetical protein
MNYLAPITDIPDTDIFLFLSENNIELRKIKTDQEAYQMALNLIQSNMIQNAPDSIINWIHAYNISNQYNIGEYDIMDIISENNIIDLAQLLELKEANKSDVIEILWYLRKLYGLDVFDSMSHRSIFAMLLNLDYKTIRILCRLSDIVSAICNSNEFNPILRQKYQEYEVTKKSQY